MQAATQEERATILTNGMRVEAAGRTALELHRRTNPARIRQPVVDRTHGHEREASARRQPSIPCRTAPTPAASTGTSRFKKRYSVTGYVVGSRLQRRARGDRRAFNRTAGTTSSVPIPRALELDPTRTSLTGGAAIDRDQQDRPASAFASTRTRRSRSPGFDINDIGFLRRADQRSIGNWLQFRNEKPNRWLRSRYINFNEYAGWNSDGDKR